MKKTIYFLLISSNILSAMEQNITTQQKEDVLTKKIPTKLLFKIMHRAMPSLSTIIKTCRKSPYIPLAEYPTVSYEQLKRDLKTDQALLLTCKKFYALMQNDKRNKQWLLESPISYNIGNLKYKRQKSRSRSQYPIFNE